MNSLERFNIEMQEVRHEIKIASGYRKKDLIRKLHRMDKQRAEYIGLRGKANSKKA